MNTTPTAPLNTSRRRALGGLGALCAGSSLLLTGCFSEPKERKAFIEFLETKVLTARGLSYPIPNENMRKTFGDYAKHYDIVLNFIKKVDALPVAKQVEKMSMATSISALRANREKIKELLAAIPGGITEIQSLQANADAEKAALKQPDDLKVVYDKVYAKFVTRYAKIMLDTLPAAGNIYSAAMELLALIDQHPKEIVVSGAMTQVSNQRLLNQMNAITEKINKDVVALSKLDSELRK